MEITKAIDFLYARMARWFGVVRKRI